MKHITIKNLGPISQAEVYLEQFNIIIGPQSSGKSTLLKTVSYCLWVEKRIQLTQNPKAFEEDNYFLKRFISFHKLQGYLHKDTFVSYESNFMKFSYSHLNGVFQFEWKEQRWQYITPKISYIPAERNMVAAIPNWFEVKLPDDNIRNFMIDWQNARTSSKKDVKILNLGVWYHYDEVNKADKVIIQDGPTLDFTNTSSGLQSLIPLMVQMDFLTSIRFHHSDSSVMGQTENDELLKEIYQSLFVAKGKALQAPDQPKEIGNLDNSSEARGEIGNFVLRFKNQKALNECRLIYENFTRALPNNVIIEEPEQNLFPPTQVSLMYNLVNCLKDYEENILLLSTHSPYTVTALLERKDVEHCAVFVVKGKQDGSFVVGNASQEDIQFIYDEDIDVFYNLNTIGEWQ